MTRHRFLRGLSPWALLLGVVGAVKNAEIIRTVDLSGSTVRMVMAIRAEGEAPAPELDTSQKPDLRGVIIPVCAYLCDAAVH